MDIELLFDQNGGKSKVTKTMNKPIETAIPVRMHKQPIKTTTSTNQPQPILGTVITTKAPKRITIQQPVESLKINEKGLEKQPGDKYIQPQETFLLVSLLVITEGRGITSKEQTLPHLYCVSRAFWNKEKGQTKICWNTSDPFFQYQQVIFIRTIV